MTEYQSLKDIIQPIAEKYMVAKVSLFGSRARGTQTEESDYDFLISKGEMHSLLSYVAFVNELEDALGTHVDVVTDTSSDREFIDSIANKGVLIYER